MAKNGSKSPDGSALLSLRLREALTPIFRQRQAAACAFLALFLGSILALALRPTVYEAQMKFLVNRERVDPLLSPTETSIAPRSMDVSDTEINSEVELLRSRDLLERVVVECNLHKFREQSYWSMLFGTAQVNDAARQASGEANIPSAVKDLEGKLSVQRVKMTNLIKVTYRSRDPQLAANVLNKVANLYLEKHLAVRRPLGAFAFFQQQADRYKKELQTAQSNLTEFTRQAGIVSARQEKESALSRRGEFEALLQGEQAAIAQTRQRLLALETQLHSSPARMTTAVRVSNTSAHLDSLRTTLITLELKRTELLGKFDPGYPPVQEVAKQIAQTRTAIQDAERQPNREETSDRNSTHEWLQSELARTRAEFESLKARAGAIARSVSTYSARARALEEKESQQEELARQVKTAEDNYLLYTRKQEEARISDALDSERIVNVAISEAATVPALPAGPGWFFLLAVAGLLSAVLALATAFVVDRMDPTLRTPEEVEASLEVPVLAAFPKSAG